ncbi:capsular biosynthesis protein [Helicobacter sp.]|uniref:capsular biosynthesis protein n=1 Tax=Helicobacter sp. TaxID=218 RepID=UPI0025B7DD50|nr:capsular biosynthesis protein [Helicobacter sp.]MBR2495536.1 capsular biosynthesis protein [Helicobacter sp.]
MRPHIAMLADFDTTKRPRPHRMIIALRDIARLFVIAREASPEAGARCFSFPAPESNAQTRTKKQNERIKALCDSGEFAPLIYTKERAQIPALLDSLPKLDLIIVEDIALLPFACDYKEKHACKILVDLREFYPLEYEDKQWLEGLGKLFAHLCAQYLPKADGCLCVSAPIAARYLQDFGIASILYYSLPPYHNLTPSKTSAPIRLIYHGLISEERGSTNLLELAKELGDGYEIYCQVLSNRSDFLARFITQADPIPNCHILPPVSLEEIIPSCNGFDIGIISLQDTSFNNKNAMPNKLFEYIQSRLCVVATPLDSIKEFFAHYEVGITSSDFSASSIAHAVRSLSIAQIMAYKSRAHSYAKELSLDSNAKKARQIVRDLLAK